MGRAALLFVFMRRLWTLSQPPLMAAMMAGRAWARLSRTWAGVCEVVASFMALRAVRFFFSR
jgi:hypothetical protein